MVLGRKTCIGHYWGTWTLRVMFQCCGVGLLGGPGIQIST